MRPTGQRSRIIGAGRALAIASRPKLSAGLEGGALGNEEYSAGRAGGFVRFDLLDTELTLAGGFTGNYLWMMRAAMSRSLCIVPFRMHLA